MQQRINSQNGLFQHTGQLETRNKTDEGEGRDRRHQNPPIEKGIQPHS